MYTFVSKAGNRKNADLIVVPFWQEKNKLKKLLKLKI